ncbi:MAG TPA: [acyl-carrier-protein] S-malonyltransferase [Sorangium sp.]|nr:[acyl-carrier-protein] S-malonyltransferase [Sorangium sp.]
MAIGWLFPGQGAQKVGMGRDVHQLSAAARAVFEQADEALGMALSRLCFEGPMAALTRTENTQPALVTTSLAYLAAARERYPELSEPACAAGHSLGEYSALCAAGALSLADAVRVARARGRAMQAAVAPGVGAMAAIIGQDDATLAGYCADVAGPGAVVAAANYNSPGQTVIAGHAAAVAAVVERVRGAGGKAIPLKVSAPFHCALMAPAVAPLELAFAAARFCEPRFAVLANVDASPRSDAAAVQQALLQQVDHPVQWVRTIEKMRQLGVTGALEFGPGRVLSGLCKRIDRELTVVSINSVAALDKLEAFLAQPAAPQSH